MKGECNEVHVNGSTNAITIDVAANIVLESADNTELEEGGARRQTKNRRSVDRE